MKVFGVVLAILSMALIAKATAPNGAYIAYHVSEADLDVEDKVDSAETTETVVKREFKA